MREQSHKDEMARALRGDFARLRARGVATTLEPTHVPTQAVPDESCVGPTELPRDERAGGPWRGGVPDAVVEGAAPSPTPSAPTSWLDRLRGRR